MPRPSPEIFTTNLTATYVAGNGFTNQVYRTVKTHERSYTGTKTPGYPKVVRENSHQMRLTKYKPGLFTTMRSRIGGRPWDWDRWSDVYEQMGSLSMPVRPWDCFISSSSERLVLDKAMDRVADAAVNAAQMFAERKQVVDLIHDTAKRLADTIVALKRRDWSRASKALGLARPRKLSGNVASDWLALQYGWLPLLGDIHDSAEFFARRHKVSPPLVVGYGRAAGYVDGSSVEVDASNIGIFLSRVGLHETKSSCVLRFQLSNALMRGGHQTGITNPLLLAWELAPWSFVADWFLPVGDFLGRLNYDSGLTWHSGYLVSKATSQGALLALRPKDYGTLRCVPSGTVLECDNVWVRRQALSAPPRPVLPKFEDPFTPTRAANAIALFRAQFR